MGGGGGGELEWCVSFFIFIFYIWEQLGVWLGLASFTSLSYDLSLEHGLNGGVLVLEVFIYIYITLYITDSQWLIMTNG